VGNRGICVLSSALRVLWLGGRTQDEPRKHTGYEFLSRDPPMAHVAGSLVERLSTAFGRIVFNRAGRLLLLETIIPRGVPVSLDTVCRVHTAYSTSMIQVDTLEM
jgi:hypothetical protein